MLEICQENNLTQRRKDAKKNHLFRAEGAKIFPKIMRLLLISISLTLATLPILGNETALPLKRGTLRVS